MKKTFYLFNPGILERKDNTLKFTPCAEEGEDMSVTSQPRYLPVEDISEFYVFGSLRANSSLFNFLGQKDIAVHFFDYYENYTGSFMPRDSLLSGRMLLAQTSYYQNLKKRMCIAQKFIEGAAYNMIKNLQYYNRRGKDMEELIDAFRPDEMSIEELFFSKNITTGIAVAHARGVILCAAEKKRLPIYEYTPMQVKQAVVGYGLADKKQVMDMTKRLLKLKAVPRPDDAADALAIALCHARSATSLLRRTNPGVKETV